MTTELHNRWQWGFAKIGCAARDHDVCGAGRSRRQALLQPFRLDRLRPGRSEADKTKPLRAADRDAGRRMLRLAAVGGDVGHQQSNDLAVVVGDRRDKRALGAAIVADPAQLHRVLGAQGQAARFGEVNVAGRAVEGSRAIVEALGIGRGLDIGKVVYGVAFARNEGPDAGMAGEPRARPCGRILVRVEMLDQLKRTVAVLARTA